MTPAVTWSRPRRAMGCDNAAGSALKAAGVPAAARDAPIALVLPSVDGMSERSSPCLSNVRCD
jgi:hypothetical protein